MSSRSAPRVAVVGAGFCGAVLAHHLTRTDDPALAEGAGAPAVTLVDRGGEFGPGLAYRTGDPRHLLNTPAGRMSALAGDPDHFTRWARVGDPAIGGGSFLPRGRFGAYLRQLVDAARQVALADGAPALTCLSGHVIAVRPPEGDHPAELILADGRSVPAERVVLAPGNLAPAVPAGLPPEIGADPRYIHDPWSRPCPPIPGDATVLILGTGLSALDLALGFHGAGHRGPIHLLSRHGLVPHAHRAPARPPLPRPPAIETWPPTARGYLRALRAAVGAEAARGGDWRDVIADLRPVTQALWRRLPPAERDRFVRHLRVYWEVHRHRAAPATAAGVAAMRATGQLRIHAGRIEHMSLESASIAVVVRPRGARARVQLAADLLLNATGPASDPRATDDPLLADLVARGLLAPDPLGAAVDDEGAVLDAAGRPSTWLHAVGALRRPQLWETTAALELAPQCEALARRLRAELS